MAPGHETEPPEPVAVRVLERVVPAPPEKPVRPGASETQSFARRVAEDAGSWGPEEALATAARFDLLAQTWDDERSSYRRAPLADALARGGPWTAGICVEIGSGTGVLTPLLLERWPVTVCVDLSAGMLARAPAGLKVRTDASRAGIAAHVAAAVVVGDAPLFAGEIVRLLRTDGMVVWVNALGPDAPYWIPAETVRDALCDASGATWEAVTSDALWGTWVVLRPRRALTG